MSELTGYPPDELIGQHISSLPFTPESLDQKPFRFDLLQQGKTVVSERTLIRPDAFENIVNTHTKMMPNGTYQSIFRDISEQKRTEKLMVEHSKELMRFNEIMTGRELRMLELRKEINTLCRELGKPEPYTLESIKEEPS